MLKRVLIWVLGIAVIHLIFFLILLGFSFGLSSVIDKAAIDGAAKQEHGRQGSIYKTTHAARQTEAYERIAAALERLADQAEKEDKK